MKFLYKSAFPEPESAMSGGLEPTGQGGEGRHGWPRATSWSSWFIALLALATSVVLAQFFYLSLSSGGHLRENQLHFPHYHLTYLAIFSLLYIIALVGASALLRRMTGAPFARSLRRRVIGLSPLLFLFPYLVNFESTKTRVGYAGAYASLTVVLLLNLLLFYREASDYGNRRRYWVFLAVTLMLVAGASLRSYFWFRSMRFLDSDEAIIGLMAKHILFQGSRPVFFYGQNYLSSLDAYLAAILFFFIGRIAPAIKLIAFLPQIASIPLIYFIGKELDARRTGLFAALLFSVSPIFLVIFSSLELGGYSLVIFFGSLTLLLLIKMGDDSFREQYGLWPWAALGFLLGLLFYLHPMSIPLVFSTGLFVLVRHRHHLRWAPLLLLATFFFLACLPIIYYNLHFPFSLLKELEVRSGSPRSLSDILQRSKNIIYYSLPILAGLREGARLNFSRWFTLLISLIYVLPFPYLLYRLVILCQSKQEKMSAPHRMKQRDGLLLILLTLLFTLLLYLFSAYVVDQWATPRHLLILYIPLSLALGLAFSHLFSYLERTTPGWMALLSSVLVIIMLFSFLCYTNLRSMEKRIQSVESGPQVYNYYEYTFSQIIDFLLAHDLRFVHTGYWTCYKLAFESNEQIIPSPLAGPVIYERYPKYTEQVEESNRVAVIYPAHAEVHISIFRKKMEELGIAYREIKLGDYLILWDFSSRFDIRSFDLPLGEK